MTLKFKGGVIMDVTDPKQAKLAEEAGAAAVMALERVPADIGLLAGIAHERSGHDQKHSGVGQIPVMAKVRIGHFSKPRYCSPSELILLIKASFFHPPMILSISIRPDLKHPLYAAPGIWGRP